MEYSNQHKHANIKYAYIFELACLILSHWSPKGLYTSCDFASFVSKQLLQCWSHQRRNSGPRFSASYIYWQIFVLYLFSSRGGARLALPYVTMTRAAMLRPDSRQQGWKQEGQLGIVWAKQARVEGGGPECQDRRVGSWSTFERWASLTGRSGGMGEPEQLTNV